MDPSFTEVVAAIEKSCETHLAMLSEQQLFKFVFLNQDILGQSLYKQISHFVREM